MSCECAEGAGHGRSWGSVPFSLYAVHGYEDPFQNRKIYMVWSRYHLGLELGLANLLAKDKSEVRTRGRLVVSVGLQLPLDNMTGVC